MIPSLSKTEGMEETYRCNHQVAQQIPINNLICEYHLISTSPAHSLTVMHIYPLVSISPLNFIFTKHLKFKINSPADQA